MPSTSSASRTFFWLTGSQFGTSNFPGPPGCSTLIASCSAWTFFDVLRIVGIDQRADPDEHVAGADLLPRERVACRRRRLTAGRYWSSSITCIDMKRLPASGSVIVTGPASRSNTADEYSVSRLSRMMVWSSIGDSSRWCSNLPNPPLFQTTGRR